jgi:hypothetical protein
MTFTPFLMAKGSAEGRLEVKTFDFQFVPHEHTGLYGGDVDRPGFGWFPHVLFLSLSCRHTARPNAGRRIQCANGRIFGIGDASPDADDA